MPWLRPGIHEELGGHAQLLERHVKLHRLRARHPGIALHHVDHGGRLGVRDVLQRRLVPVGVEVLVEEVVADVELAVPLHVALGVHADPVHGAGAGADGLEAVGVGQDPVGPVATGAPSERAHAVAVHDALGDEVVDAGHDVVEAQGEVVADDVGAVGVAVVGGAPVVGLEHGVPGAGVDLGAVSAVEAEDVGARPGRRGWRRSGDTACPPR